MNQNVDQGAMTDGQRMESAGGQQEVRGLNEQIQGLFRKPGVNAAVTGAVVAAVIFNIPEALLGAAAGVAVYAIRQRHSATKAKASALRDGAPDRRA